MASLAATYRLKRFQKSSDPDFAAALILYVRNTAAAIRTDTNEITYWLDQFSEQFGNPFYVFGFYRDRQLVGFAEAAYFRTERLLVFDYLVIEETQRRNNVFFEFVDHLKRYFEDVHPDYRYAVLEVGYGVGQTHPSQESCLITRLLKLQGFRVIRAPYCQPRLVLDDAESQMNADLLIYSTNDLERLRTSTYLSIVRTIYYLYYLPWKTLVPGAKTGYEKHIDEMYAALETKLQKVESVVVNGHKIVLKATTAKPIMTIHRVVSFALQALLLVILLTAAMLGLRAIFHLSDVSFAIVYGIAIASFVVVAAMVSKDARSVFMQLIDLTKHLLPKGLPLSANAGTRAGGIRRAPRNPRQKVDSDERKP
jgi:hypothetical protein